MEFKVFVKCFTFNHSRYIKAAMDGFCQQNTDFPFVCAIMDDASTDGNQKVISDYLKDNFTLLEEESRETDDYVYTLSRCNDNPSCYFAVFFLKYNHYKKKPKRQYLEPLLQISQYAARCEGDDYWTDPMKLRKQAAYLDAHPECALCGTNGEVIYEADGRKVLFNRFRTSHVLGPEELIGHWVFPTASLFYRREVTDNYPDWTNGIYSGDQTLILIAMSKGEVYAMTDVTCVYRKDDANATSVSQMARKKHPREYVTQQHIKLYNEYDNYTGGRYRKWIVPLLKRLSRREKVYSALNISMLKAFAADPLMFCEIVLKRKNNK